MGSLEEAFKIKFPEEQPPPEDEAELARVLAKLSADGVASGRTKGDPKMAAAELLGQCTKKRFFDDVEPVATADARKGIPAAPPEVVPALGRTILKARS